MRLRRRRAVVRPWYENECRECGLHIPTCLSRRLDVAIAERDEARRLLQERSVDAT